VLATEHEGLLRLLFAIAGFSGYLFFLAHALKELGLPSTISGDAPDGEVRRKPALRTARKTAGRDRDFTLAA
jgi:hypothetical protein